MLKLLTVSILPPRPSTLKRRLNWRIRVWLYSRLANAGRLQIGRLEIVWPMPWHPCVRNDPSYVHGRPSGMLNFMGWYDQKPKGGA